MCGPILLHEQLLFSRKGEKVMVGILWTIAVILFVLWLLGFLVFHLGALIHIVLVIAIIVVVWNLVTSSRRRAL
jgi:hypothetical protein